MNQLDSQRMAGQLMQQGLLPTREPAEADVILLNSCSVREKAEQKVYSRLGQYRQFKEERPNLRIGLCGCVAEQAGERALKRVPDLDFVLGTGRIADLTDVLERRNLGERVVATGFDTARYEFDSIAREGEYKGMVTIIEGCNKNCTFCIVPTTRGPERCRPKAQVLREVEHLVEYGFHEIELLGQTVNHWRDPQTDEDFGDLLDAIARIPGVDRLRFVTSYPRDFTQHMVDQFARHENICPYLHIPVQSGSDAVLKRMGRGHEIALYYELVDRLRAARPGIALSTDLIVGFPGETDEDFEQTLDLIRQVRYASIYAFKYSPRPGTAAPKLAGEVAPELASERLQRLFDTQAPIQLELNQEMVGRSLEVLVTGWNQRSGEAGELGGLELTGRTTCHRVVHFPADPDQLTPLGSMTTVKITAAYPHSLLASVSSTASAQHAVVESPAVKA